jgi:tetratricopeptide (TPR) repeat protein
VNTEVKALNLMGAASAKLAQGESQMAVQLYSTAAKFEFEDQRHARLGAGIAKARCFRYSEARKDFESLLADKNVAPEGTVFRADALRWLADVKIAQDQLDGIDSLLKEAAIIYKHQGVLAPLGAVIHMQGFVAGQREKPDEALDKFEWGARYAQINIPGIVPFTLSLDQPIEAIVSLAEAALV